MVPGNLRYTKTHEWAVIDGEVVKVGISKFAADQLTDITYIELPAVGKKLIAGATCGSVETVKAVSDLYSPIDGEVVAVNSGLTTEAGPLTSDPYGAGWLFKLKVGGPLSTETLSRLMTPEQYQKQLESEAH